jgi:hypothetical protein
MKKKISGVLVCLMLMTTTMSVAGFINKNTIENPTILSIIGDWTEDQKLFASDAAQGIAFGYSVSISGETALIGACYDDDSGSMSGSVYVFIYNGTTWTQQAKLLASDGAAFDYFGNSVSIFGDTALIGAHGDDNYKGSAYVFTLSGTTWIQQAKLLASDASQDDWFGYSVSLSGDTALIGAHGDEGYTGATYVFTRSGTTWSQQQKIVASDGGSMSWFGYSVSIDGDTALIGAHWVNDYQGAAYVFIRTGTTWSQQQKIVASDGAPWDYFGWCVSLDENTALISALYDDDNGADSGSVYVYTRTGTTWNEEAKLLAFDGAANDQFSCSVMLDGDTAVVGAWADDDQGSDSGSAYIFTRTGSTWQQDTKLLASDGAMDCQFGTSVAVAGTTAFIGSPGTDNFKGAVYVYTTEYENQPPAADFSWTPQNPITNQQITFNASVSQDPDGTIALYEWDWDNDGVYDESYGVPTATHTWVNIGSYPVTVRVTDDDTATGTITKTVNVSGTVNFTIDITGGFGVTAVITNTGTINATNIQWTFTLTGGFILLGMIKSGTSLPLRPGATATIKVKPIIGFGKTTIKVEVTCSEGVSFTKSVPGTVFLFFVLGVK